MKIAIASDHGGFELKQEIVALLTELKMDFEYDTGRLLDPYDQIQKADRHKERGMEL